MHFPNTKKIKLKARPPYGKSWFIASLDPQPVNLYRRYARGRTQIKFVELSAEDLMAFLQERLSDGQIMMGHAEMAMCAADGRCE